MVLRTKLCIGYSQFLWAGLSDAEKNGKRRGKAEYASDISEVVLNLYVGSVLT